MKTLSVALPLLFGASALLVGSGVVSCPLKSGGTCDATVATSQAATPPTQLPTQTQVATVRHIGIDEFEAMRSGSASPYLLDVREPFELTTRGKIPGVVNIPLGAIEDRRSELPSDLETPIYTICQTGNRSAKAAEQLVQLGYRTVYSLDGGTGEWIGRQK